MGFKIKSQSFVPVERKKTRSNGPNRFEWDNFIWSFLWEATEGEGEYNDNIFFREMIDGFYYESASNSYLVFLRYLLFILIFESCKLTPNTIHERANTEFRFYLNKKKVMMLQKFNQKNSQKKTKKIKCKTLQSTTHEIINGFYWNMQRSTIELTQLNKVNGHTYIWSDAVDWPKFNISNRIEHNAIYRTYNLSVASS